jgi:hypothetical protein
MTDVRVVENVTENHEALEETLIIPGFKWRDFGHCPEPPVSAGEDKWDFIATDFATDTYGPLATYLNEKYKMVNGAVVKPEGIWLRYHGMNLYALSSMLATNHAIPSDTALEGAETACGRGVYTSREWKKARQYAVPHQLDGSSCLTKIIALFVIPGASGEGGTAIWKQKIRSVWGQNADGQWESRPKWFLVPEDAVDEACWEKEECEDPVPYPLLHNRIKNRRVKGIGEVPWTTADGTPDNSNED